MAQDKNRVGESDVIQSVFNFNGMETGSINSGYVIEAVDVNKPDQRAYIYLDDLAGLRGPRLENYINDCLDVKGPKRNSKVKADINTTIARITLSMTP